MKFARPLLAMRPLSIARDSGRGGSPHSHATVSAPKPVSAPGKRTLPVGLLPDPPCRAFSGARLFWVGVND